MKDTSRQSAIGRLLAELSWSGDQIRGYRNGGVGRENVLTTEVLQALDFLPRRMFLGAVVEAARGADAARDTLALEVEDARIAILPPASALDVRTDPAPLVYPDALIESPGVFCVVEAKGPRKGSFQREQLAREYVLARQRSAGRRPLLLLVLPSPPPVKVDGLGKITPREAIGAETEGVLAGTPSLGNPLDDADDVVCWITWDTVKEVVAHQLADLADGSSSTQACIARLAGSLIEAVDRHRA